MLTGGGGGAGGIQRRHGGGAAAAVAGASVDRTTRVTNNTSPQNIPTIYKERGMEDRDINVMHN
ncbi:hypothetical protein LINGRAHAP2_LOCUS7648 [Linum grandiflorum]